VQDLQQRAETKVAGLEAHIAMLKDQIASLQVWPLWNISVSSEAVFPMLSLH